MADLSPNIWRRAEIVRITRESPRIKTFRLHVDGLYPFVAGQHLSIRVPTAHGTATRDYSFSSAPINEYIEVTVAHAPGGEVSGWLCGSAHVGDTIEISPPIGQYFNWTPLQPEPLLLIAGGVGIGPLMSILREHRLSKTDSLVNVFYSARNYDEICYRDELRAARPNEAIVFTLTESIPGDWQGNNGRIDADMLRLLTQPEQTIYVCGPTQFVETVNDILVNELSFDPNTVKSERFG